MKVELIKWKKLLSENNMLDGWTSIDNLNFKENYQEMTSCGINLKESSDSIVLASTLYNEKIYNAIKIYKKDIIQRFSYDTNKPYVEREVDVNVNNINFNDVSNESRIDELSNSSENVDINTFIEKYNEDYSIKQLAKYFNVSNCEIRDIKRKLISEGKIQPSKWEKHFTKENKKWSHPKSLEEARYNGPCKGRFNVNEFIKDVNSNMRSEDLVKKHKLSKGSLTNIKRYLISQNLLDSDMVKSKPSHKITKIKGTDLIRSDVPSLETQLIDRIDWVKRYNISVPAFKKYYENHTGNQTASVFNLDQRIVSKIAKQLGINKRASYTKARIYNPLETISDSQFKWDYNNLTQKEIARKYNIPQGKVSVKVKLMKLDGKI